MSNRSRLRVSGNEHRRIGRGRKSRYTPRFIRETKQSLPILLEQLETLKTRNNKRLDSITMVDEDALRTKIVIPALPSDDQLVKMRGPSVNSAWAVYQCILIGCDPQVASTGQNDVQSSCCDGEPIYQTVVCNANVDTFVSLRAEQLQIGINGYKNCAERFIKRWKRVHSIRIAKQCIRKQRRGDMSTTQVEANIERFPEELAFLRFPLATDPDRCDEVNLFNFLELLVSLIVSGRCLYVHGDSSADALVEFGRLGIVTAYVVAALYGLKSTDAIDHARQLIDVLHHNDITPIASISRSSSHMRAQLLAKRLIERRMSMQIGEMQRETETKSIDDDKKVVLTAIQRGARVYTDPSKVLYQSPPNISHNQDRLREYMRVVNKREHRRQRRVIDRSRETNRAAFIKELERARLHLTSVPRHLLVSLRELRRDREVDRTKLRNRSVSLGTIKGSQSRIVLHELHDSPYSKDQREPRLLSKRTKADAKRSTVNIIVPTPDARVANH